LAIQPDVKMIPHQMQEGVVFYEIFRAIQRMSIAAQFALLHKLRHAGPVASRLRVSRFVARRNHHADLVDFGRQNLVDNNPQHGFLRAIAVDQRLQRQSPLILSRCRNDRFSDSHVVALAMCRPSTCEATLNCTKGGIGPTRQFTCGPFANTRKTLTYRPAFCKKPSLWSFSLVATDKVHRTNTSPIERWSSIRIDQQNALRVGSCISVAQYATLGDACQQCTFRLRWVGKVICEGGRSGKAVDQQAGAKAIARYGVIFRTVNEPNHVDLRCW